MKITIELTIEELKRFQEDPFNQDDIMDKVVNQVLAINLLEEEK